MPRKRRRSSRRWISSAVGLIILLAFAAYSPIVNWWQSISSTSKFLLLAGTGLAMMVAIGAAFAFFIYRQRERDRIWRIAMAGWQNASRSEENRRTQSALHL